ncbi:MAG TPA: hypothetical protein DDZ42_19015 [Candidatus Rokubacteria bacterium]|nr:hypothetical protein [Candidatus Rokubacteria bacterium]
MGGGARGRRAAPAPGRGAPRGAAAGRCGGRGERAARGAGGAPDGAAPTGGSAGPVIATLSRRERLLVIAAVGVVAVVGGFTLAIQPILEANRATAELVPAREQALQQRRALVLRRGAIASDLEATSRRLGTVSARLLTSATPAVAASELQKLAKDMTAQARTEIRSERILEPKERGELLEVSIEIAVSGEIRQLVDLLGRVEAAPKLLSVQNLRVRVVSLAQPRDLLATVTLSGFILPAKART